jgi:hypothetical protein
MKSEHLHDLWESPDNTRLLSKQFSFRLPTHIAAKLAALGDIYPQKNRTQIVADLLTTALDELEKNLPYTIEPIDELSQIEQDRASYEDGMEQMTFYDVAGPRGMFRHLSNKYYEEYEKELGNEVSRTLYPWGIGTKESVEDLLK